MKKELYNMIKQRLQSKTYYLAFLILVGTYVQNNYHMLSNLLGPYADLIGFGVGLAVIILREATFTSLSEK